jgi:diguanylate cyclase (GGDEF)-like protein
MSGQVDAATSARILVVDDDLHTRTLLKELCESQGYEVEEASDGVVALEKVTARPPDLVLLDLMLPGLNGFAVLSQIRSNHDRPHVPVIILTAAGDMDGKIKGIELGADDYITKPFRLFELTMRVTTALTMRRYRERLLAAEQELEGLRGVSTGVEAASYSQLRWGLDYELARAKRYGRPLATLLACVENFDEVRTSLGRTEMDRLSLELVDRFRHSVREVDRLYRIDIDEFVALLPETGMEGARVAAQRLVDSIPAQLTVKMEIGVGVGIYGGAGASSPEEMMRAAQRDLEESRTK